MFQAEAVRHRWPLVGRQLADGCRWHNGCQPVCEIQQRRVTSRVGRRIPMLRWLMPLDAVSYGHECYMRSHVNVAARLLLRKPTGYGR